MRGPLRMLLPLCIAVLMVSVAVAEKKLDEAKAIEEIKLLGGTVKRNDTLPNRPVIGIDFRGSTKLGDKYLYLLKVFTSLTTLDLSDIQITDAGLK